MKVAGSGNHLIETDDGCTEVSRAVFGAVVGRVRRLMRNAIVLALVLASATAGAQPVTKPCAVAIAPGTG